MSLFWRGLTAPSLIAGVVLLTASGCKSGGGWWSPGSNTWGSAESSTSDLAVSRPPTRVPTPSSGAKPTTPGDVASTRGSTGAQNGPYAAGAAGSADTASSGGYGTTPAGWQGEPHSSVAPAGGYRTGQYGMASNSKPQPGVTPGAYAQPYAPGAQPDSRAADPASQPEGLYGQPDPSAAAADPASAAVPAGDSTGSIYQDSSPPSNYAAPDPAAAYGIPPPSDAPGAVSEPASTIPETPLYGPAATYDGGGGESSNPAAGASVPAARAVANPYTLSGANTPPPTNPTASLPSSPIATTSPTTAITPYDPPTLPSSLSATPGSYRPGSTAAPGTIYGTGYDTTDGTMMR